MKVKEILKMTAEMAGESQLRAYYEQNAVDDVANCEENATLLLRCYNMIIEELALEYLPLMFKEELQSDNQKIYFSAFTHKPLRILAVYAENGKKVPYRFVNDYLEVENGKLSIEYYYRPNRADEEDEVVYNDTLIGFYTIAYGMLSQYLLERGRVSESNIYQEKYLNAVRARIAQRNNLKLPGRRWI